MSELLKPKFSKLGDLLIAVARVIDNARASQAEKNSAKSWGGNEFDQMGDGYTDNMHQPELHKIAQNQ